MWWFDGTSSHRYCWRLQPWLGWSVYKNNDVRATSVIQATCNRCHNWLHFNARSCLYNSSRKYCSVLYHWMLLHRSQIYYCLHSHLRNVSLVFMSTREHFRCLKISTAASNTNTSNCFTSWVTVMLEAFSWQQSSVVLSLWQTKLTPTQIILYCNLLHHYLSAILVLQLTTDYTSTLHDLCTTTDCFNTKCYFIDHDFIIIYINISEM